MIGAICVTVAVALLVPAGGRVFVELRLVDAGVVIVMFLGSLKIELARFRAAARRAHLIGLSLVSVFAVAPLVALGLAGAFGLDSDADRVAVLVCAAQASTLATAIVLTEVAGGDVALAILITVVNNTATALVTPAVFHLLCDAAVEVHYGPMALEMALKVVAPVVVGQVARRWLAARAHRHRRALSIASQLVILTYIYTGVASTVARAGAHPGALLVRVLALAATLHASLLLINALVARIASRRAEERAAFVLCSSQKTLPAAILVWKSHFASLAAGPLVAVAYHMLQLVVDSLLAPGFRRLPLVRDPRGAAGSDQHERKRRR